MVVEDLHDLVRLLEERPEWRAELRKVLLGDELLQLPELVREILEIQRQHSQAIERLVEAQRRTEQRLEELAQAQKELSEAQKEMAETQREMSRQLNRLVEWQRGEAGRRDGERYEQETLRRAVALFAGGEGGSAHQPHVQSALYGWLSSVYHESIPEPTKDPSLADIVWWKGDQVVVAEVSLKVDAQDIHRARQRAETLRAAGVKTTPVVIGEEWATADTQALAQREGVEWMVAGGLSQGFLEFRGLPHPV